MSCSSMTLRLTHYGKPMITGYNFNEVAAFLPFDPNATAPPPDPPLSGARGLACGVLNEAK